MSELEKIATLLNDVWSGLSDADRKRAVDEARDIARDQLDGEKLAALLHVCVCEKATPRQRGEAAAITAAIMRAHNLVVERADGEMGVCPCCDTIGVLDTNGQPTMHAPPVH